MQTRAQQQIKAGPMSEDVPSQSPLGNHLHPLGTVSVNRPIPLAEEYTTHFEAGALGFAVEHRELNEQVINDNFAFDPGALAAVHAMHAENGFPDDDGLSLHVFDSENDYEVLRFDMFADDPHYHYMPNGPFHVVVPYDPAASGDMWLWTLSALTNRLPSLLRNAGHGELATKIDSDLVTRVLEKVAEHVERLAVPVVGSVL